MSDLAQLESWRDALKKALFSGHHAVQQGDKRIQFRSVAEIERALTKVEGEIAEASGRRRPRMFRSTHRRGL